MSTQHNPAVILQIIPALGAGGAEQGCIDMAAAIVKSGARALVASNGGSRIHELARVGADHINLPVHSKNPLVMWQNIARIRQIIRRYQVSLVHVRSRAPAWSALRACKLSNVPFLTTCHAPYNTGGKLKTLYNSSIARGDLVIAISDTVSEYLQKEQGLNPARIRVIPRGIALEKFHPTAVTPERLIALAREWRIPDGTNVVMLPGRLTRWKGHHVLIKALALLKRRDLFGVIIGADQGRSAYRTELEESIQSHDLNGQIRIVDHCNDMPAAYMLATIVVSASTDPEGFGRVPVEAQAMGRLVIATDHGGARETVRAGETGWLVEPGNEQELANAITEALALPPSQRATLATRSMSHIAENFTRELMCERTLDVYAELLRTKKIQNQSAPETNFRQSDKKQNAA